MAGNEDPASGEREIKDESGRALSRGDLQGFAQTNSMRLYAYKLGRMSTPSHGEGT